jgi:hypothetical protein
MGGKSQKQEAAANGEWEDEAGWVDDVDAEQ